MNDAISLNTTEMNVVMLLLDIRFLWNQRDIPCYWVNINAKIYWMILQTFLLKVVSVFELEDIMNCKYTESLL